MHLAIFNFEKHSTVELKNHGCEVSFEKSFDSANENRTRSYWAARCATRFLMHKVNKKGLLSKDKEFGFPILTDQAGKQISGVFLSLSHTEQTVIAAMSDLPIGVDVERSDRNAENVTERILSDNEKIFLKHVSENEIPIDGGKISKSLLLWVMKESAAKATGLGLTKGLDVFEVSGLLKFPTTVKGPAGTRPLSVYPFIVDKNVFSVARETDLISGVVSGGFWRSTFLFRLLDLDGKFEQIDGFK